MFSNKLQKILIAMKESLTGFMAVISSDHAYIHEGLAFTAIVNAGEISAATKIGFVTPTVASGKYIHWRPLDINTSANYVELILYEGDTFTGGTTVTPINRNRTMSTTTSNMQSFKLGVTATPTGTIIQISGVGTEGRPASRAGGQTGADQEILLKANTSYVAVATPAGATTVVGSFFWYEEEGH